MIYMFEVVTGGFLVLMLHFRDPLDWNAIAKILSPLTRKDESRTSVSEFNHPKIAMRMEIARSETS